ncbi:hypothetical protein [Bauldia litoralis]|uniref:Collagen triple helix repeat-containing protein n=1 Tax=Bauldia litoralis TaxID=665467 RepID=A0A1G6EJB6_9HYPH|nr:hypothetical protein [Bauldia litoralis]SDB57460.1 hypothetical protein SAMN02982931_04563 [Bauldia litoralis]
MTDRIELTTTTGPIRVRALVSESVRLWIAAVPVSVRVLGTPGPDGRLGETGPQGPVGPPGNLETGIVVDGGNF